jgi:hypothetical protein
MITNGLGGYICEAPWAPVYHIRDDKDRGGPRNVGFFYACDEAACPKTLLEPLSRRYPSLSVFLKNGTDKETTVEEVGYMLK